MYVFSKLSILEIGGWIRDLSFTVFQRFGILVHVAVVFQKELHNMLTDVVMDSPSVY